MGEERNRKKVYDEMRKELRNDRAKSSVLPLTEFGLMQITRQRIRQSIVRHTFGDLSGLRRNGSARQPRNDHPADRALAGTIPSSDRKNARSYCRFIRRCRNAFERISFLHSRKLELKYLMRIKLELDDTLMGDDFKFLQSSAEKRHYHRISPRPRGSIRSRSFRKHPR